MKKLSCLILVVILNLTMLSACKPIGSELPLSDPDLLPVETPTSIPTETPIETPDELPSELYLLAKQDFVQKYKSALSQIADGVVPASQAPTDPGETGFAIIPLPEEKYGADIRVCLPYTRDLTDEEILWIAYAVGEVSEFLDFRAYVANRELTKDEKIRYCKARELYLYKKARASELYSANPQNGDVLLFGENRVYPLEITDEQFLHIIDYEFRNVAQEVWDTRAFPAENQLQYDELEKVIKKITKEYALSDMPLETFTAVYKRLEGMGDKQDRSLDAWQVSLFFADVDYIVYIGANDGLPQQWDRFPKDYIPYTNWEPLGSWGSYPSMIAEGTPYSDDEIKQAALEYLEKIFESGSLSYVDMYESDTFTQVRFSIDERSFSLRLNKYDLFIFRFLWDGCVSRN